MTEGQFSTGVNDAWTLLKDIGLGEEKIPWPEKPVRRLGELEFEYEKEWARRLDLRAFDIRLGDFGLLDFIWIGGEHHEVSYSYYPCPKDVPSYEEFLLGQGMDPDKSGDLFREEYEEELATVGLRETILPVRYDYNPTAYRAGRHPASHIHIGRETHVRLATEKVLKPASFACFVTRQFYPSYWMKLLAYDARAVVSLVRDGLEPIESHYWCREDYLELYLR